MKRRAPTLGPISLALGIALLAACGVPGLSAEPSAADATRTSSADAATSAMSSPTAEPTPTPTSAGELVLRITYAYFASHWTATSLVADGRLTSPSDSGWQVRVLSPGGVERVRGEVFETGLFAGSADYPLVPVPNQDIGCVDGLGLTFGAAIELANDAGTVTVSWGRTGAPEGCFEPSAARDTLETLLARLDSLDDWLPADAWQDKTLRPYDPHGFRLITITQPWQPSVGDQPDVASVAWPLADSLVTFGEAVTPPIFADTWTARCGGVRPDDANLVTNALADAGATMSDSMPSGFASIALLHDPANESLVAVILEALPPDMTGCARLDLGYLNCWQVGAIQPFYCAVP